jgi:hypothetical protein
MQIFNSTTYKVQLPGTQMGKYTLDDKYLALDNEKGPLMVVLASHFMPGEMVTESELVMIHDHSDDPISSPWKLYSKLHMSSEELVQILQECTGMTIECCRQVGILFITVAYEPHELDKVYVMDMSTGYDRLETYANIEKEPGIWTIEQVIR